MAFKEREHNFYASDAVSFLYHGNKQLLLELFRAYIMPYNWTYKNVQYPVTTYSDIESKFISLA